MIRKYDVYQVDAFTQRLFNGNPAGVVLSADGLTEREMLCIARELNNSETAFIFSSHEPNYDVHIRFFTPTTEVPICGHATIAAHYVRAHEQKLGHCVTIQKTGAGLLPVEITPHENDYLITMTQGAISFSGILPPSIQHEIVCALGLAKTELDIRCPMQIVSTGHSKVMIGIQYHHTLQNLQPNLAQLKDLSSRIGCNGYFIFTLEEIGDGALTHGRMFAPAIGINEDPVTGNAHGPLGAYLVEHKLIAVAGNKVEFTGIQGEAIGHPGKIHVIVSVKNGLPEQVKITGNAIIVFRQPLF